MTKELTDIVNKSAAGLFPVKRVSKFKTTASFDLNSKMRNAYRLGAFDALKGEFKTTKK